MKLMTRQKQTPNDKRDNKYYILRKLMMTVGNNRLIVKNCRNKSKDQIISLLFPLEPI